MYIFFWVVQLYLNVFVTKGDSPRKHTLKVFFFARISMCLTDLLSSLLIRLTRGTVAIFYTKFVQYVAKTFSCINHHIFHLTTATQAGGGSVVMRDS